MKRHLQWRENYKKDRYLKHLSNVDLKERLRSIVSNMHYINQKGKLSPNTSEKWTKKWTHILEEYTIRFGPYPRGIDKEYITKDLSNLESSLIKNAVKQVNKFKSDGNFLFKYSKKEYLNDSYKSGKFRISPASKYKDPSLNYAIHDDELKFQTQVSKDITFQVFDGQTKAKKGTSKPIDNKITKSIQTDYFVFCLSTMLSPRLFWDFDKADACLIIKDPKMFLDSIIETFERDHPGYTGYSQKVYYVDPVLANIFGTDIYLSKHFKYSYQQEYRVVFLPPKRTFDIEYGCVNIPKIKEMSELLTL